MFARPHQGPKCENIEDSLLPSPHYFCVRGERGVKVDAEHKRWKDWVNRVREVFPIQFCVDITSPSPDEEPMVTWWVRVWEKPDASSSCIRIIYFSHSDDTAAIKHSERTVISTAKVKEVALRLCAEKGIEVGVTPDGEMKGVIICYGDPQHYQEFVDTVDSLIRAFEAQSQKGGGI